MPLSTADILGNPARVFKTQMDGKTVWVKKSVDDKAVIWHRVQRVLSHLIPLPILKPTVSKGGSAGLEYEVERIAAFRAQGFIVPDIVARGDGWIALSDMGVVMDTVLKITPDMNDTLLEKHILSCIEQLARAHAAGLAHGRAKLNDFTLLPDGRIGFIDFEEQVDGSGIPLPALQARDLWMFSLSCARYLDISPRLISLAMAHYQTIHTDKDVLHELRRLLRVMRPLQKMLGLFEKRLKSDLKRAYLGTRALTAVFLAE